jgi:RimJ/RimL family protein N-acetyltransferase
LAIGVIAVEDMHPEERQHIRMQIPVIETERLRLRGHRLDDFGDVAAMWADASVTKQLRDQPFTREESWTRLLRYVGHWALLGFGYWVVEDKQTGQFLGEVGFADYERDLKPSLKGIPEIGWVLSTQAHGRGYATEAVHAVVAWGDIHFGANKTACIIDPENTASIRVAEKCGYREFQRTTYHGQPTILFTRSLPRGNNEPGIAGSMTQ